MKHSFPTLVGSRKAKAKTLFKKPPAKAPIAPEVLADRTPINVNLDSEIATAKGPFTDNLGLRLKMVQDFVVHELGPPLLSIDSGVAEANQILSGVLEEDTVDTNEILNSLRLQINQARDRRNIRFAIEVMSLNKNEAALMYFMHVAKTAGVGLDEKLLSQLLKSTTMPRPTEGSPVQVRPLPSSKELQESIGVGGHEAGSRRASRRTQAPKTRRRVGKA